MQKNEDILINNVNFNKSLNQRNFNLSSSYSIIYNIFFLTIDALIAREMKLK